MSMLRALAHILPIFVVVGIGYLLRRRNIIDAPYVRSANQIVFFVAIPAMLFNELTKVPLATDFPWLAALCLAGALAGHALLAWLVMHFLRIRRTRRGTFLQSSFHGNLGYIAYAVAYYAFGKQEFTRAAILSSVILVLQNTLAVWAVMSQAERPSEDRSSLVLLKNIFLNPIILSVLAALLYTGAAYPPPAPVAKGLEILAGMALPTALLLIGGSLSFGAVREALKEIVAIGVLKLLCLPLVGYLLMTAAGVPQPLLIAGLILLAAPPATVTYVMACEYGGDPELAATSVSILTLACAFSYSLWLAAFV